MFLRERKVSRDPVARRVVFGRALALAAVLCTGGTAQAQDPAALRKHVDSLSQLYRSAVAVHEAQVRDHARRDVLPAESDPSKLRIRVGALTIDADTALADLAEEIASDVWPGLQARYGSATSLLATERWLLLSDSQVADDAAHVATLVKFGRVVPGGDVEFLSRRLNGGTNVRDEFADHWRRQASQRMYDTMGEAREWLRQALGDSKHQATLLESVFRELAIGKHAGAPECLARSLSVCKIALGLGAASDSIGASLSNGARASLLQVALQFGGDGAYTRLIAGTGVPMYVRLENASRLSIDSLVGTWRTQVIEARPAPASTTPRSAVMALAWAALMCIISLRSPRWR